MSAGATLCRPAGDLACFRCCPPIRPPGYDHLDYRPELIRELAANTEAHKAGRSEGREITGFSCWGLGFLDDSDRLVGCLLHPAVNGGRDLRGATGYQDKCAREVCPQGVIFDRLEPDLRPALIETARAAGAGRDSFAFSSPKTNPLWTLLLWGGPVLSATRPAWSDPTSPLGRYLKTHPEPRSRAYLLKRLAARIDPMGLDPKRFEAEAAELCRRLTPPASPLANPPFVHRLDLEAELADFIRLGLAAPRLEKDRAAELAARIDEAIESLVHSSA